MGFKVQRARFVNTTPLYGPFPIAETYVVKCVVVIGVELDGKDVRIWALINA